MGRNEKSLEAFLNEIGMENSLSLIESDIQNLAKEFTEWNIDEITTQYISFYSELFSNASDPSKINIMMPTKMKKHYRDLRRNNNQNQETQYNKQS